MGTLATPFQKGDRWRDCMVALAEVVWDVRPVDQQTVLFAIGRASVDKGPVWEALVKTAPPERLEGLSDQLESAYLRSPGLLPALRECAKRRGRDIDAWLVQIARRLVRDAGIERILRDALERADASVAPERECHASWHDPAGPCARGRRHREDGAGGPQGFGDG